MLEHGPELRKGEETLVAVIVSHAARADAAKREVVLSHLQDRLVHPDAPRDDAGDVPFGEALVVRKRVERQRPLVAVHVLNDFLRVAIGLDREQRPEDLFLHDRHIVGDVEDDVRRKFASGSVWLLVGGEVDGGRPLSTCILKQRSEPVVGVLVDNRGVVGTVKIGIPLGDKAAGIGDELVDLVLRQEQVVDIYAHLPGVYALRP